MGSSDASFGTLKPKSPVSAIAEVAGAGVARLAAFVIQRHVRASWARRRRRDRYATLRAAKRNDACRAIAASRISAAQRGVAPRRRWRAVGAMARALQKATRSAAARRDVAERRTARDEALRALAADAWGEVTAAWQAEGGASLGDLSCRSADDDPLPTHLRDFVPYLPSLLLDFDPWEESQ